ncbi:MAG: dienelactone hydrolase family protein [Saprospiraceae bacterium]|nr:dienelactone hydrolase family protein [Saprospiraceae bacterium]
MENKTLLAGIVMFSFIVNVEAFQISGNRDDLNFPYKNMPDVFPGTKRLTWEGDLSVKMLDGAHKFIEEKIDESVSRRLKLWGRNLSSPAAYEISVEPNRKRFAQYIGVEDKSKPLHNYNIGLADKHPPVLMQKTFINNDHYLIAETSKYRVYQVRWPALNRVYGEGLLIQPKTKPVANIIAIPDADQTPEQLIGLSPGIPFESQFARHLAENGFQVLIPVLIGRTFLFPGRPQQQTYREWLYRQAFHVGRHIIGYELQKVLSAVDWFEQSSDKELKTGVAGYCEGGLLAFYAAAVDKRIDVALVSGYFNSRQQVWDEPIYRNVWGLLSEFGDAEIASLIAPRPLIIEYSSIEEITEQIEKSGETTLQVGGLTYTGYKGRLQTPPFVSVKAEYNRIDELTRPGFQPRSLISGPKNTTVRFGSAEALVKFTSSLGYTSSLAISNDIPVDKRSEFDPEERQICQVKEIEDHVQWILRDSDQERNRFFLYKVMPEFEKRNWSTSSYHPYYTPDRFIEQAKEYRKYFGEEILGKFDDALSPPDPHTRQVYDTERWTGYEVVLDVYANLFASGILLIPKDIQPGEKRPVVVCQHGRNSIPHELVEGNYTAYNNVAAKLADEGFIVYAPQNPYRGEDRYRWLHRKANTIKKTLFSFIVSQHDQTLQWLGSLAFVDKNKIAFYGLSYGGETAMRVPALLEGYCLSICSGDFGDWTRKVMDTHHKGSFMNTLEWEMPYFNMGNSFSYAEMAYLIFPKPFMVERGHDDLVQPDEWVAYEYGKVRYLYDRFNLEDNTTIEFFNGGHSMRNDGTFKFLHKQLNWP